MATVADLVDPVILQRGVDADIVSAGTSLRAKGSVTLGEFTPQRVTATVEDSTSHPVELASTEEGLSVRCDCPAGSAGLFCAHSIAAALETWERAPDRLR
jgi:uncharacterized Zn finger protein